MASLNLNNLKKSYGQVHIIKGVDLAIEDGEFVVFVGPSGCGKSTLLRMIAGLEDISSGTLKIGGKVVNTLQPKERGIAMVFQSYALYPHKTWGASREDEIVLFVAQSSMMMTERPPPLKIPAYGALPGIWKVARTHPTVPAMHKVTDSQSALLKGEKSFSLEGLRSVGLMLPMLNPESAFILELRSDA